MGVGRGRRLLGSIAVIKASPDGVCARKLVREVVRSDHILYTVEGNEDRICLYDLCEV